MSPQIAPDPAETLAYLDVLFATADAGWLTVWVAETRGTHWFQSDDLATAAATIAEASATGLNVYVGMGLQRVRLGPDRRGSAATVIGIPGVWDDLDIAGPAHARTDLPPTRAAA